MNNDPIVLKPKRKYTLRGGKTIKQTKGGNGKMDRNAGKISWKAGTGLGRK